MSVLILSYFISSHAMILLFRSPIHTLLASFSSLMRIKLKRKLVRLVYVNEHEEMENKGKTLFFSSSSLLHFALAGWLYGKVE